MAWKPTRAFLAGQPIDRSLGGGNFPDAPPDGSTYGRRNLAWALVTEEAPPGGLLYARRGSDRTWQPTITEAPNDGGIYGRSLTDWVIIPTAPGADVDRAYVDAQDALRVARSGDTMSGNLWLEGGLASIHLRLTSSSDAALQFLNQSAVLRWNLHKLIAAQGEDLLLDAALNTGLEMPVFRVSRATQVLDFAQIPTVNGNPIQAADVDRAYVDAQDLLLLPLNGSRQMTGDLILVAPLGTRQIRIAAAFDASLFFLDGANNPRWHLYKAAVAQGQDLILDAHLDSGLNMQVYRVNRATQVVDFSRVPTVNGFEIGDDRVLRSGDTMSGNLSIIRTAGNAQLALEGPATDLLFRGVGGVSRWALTFISAGGGDLYLLAISDAGPSSQVFHIFRNTQVVDFIQRPTVNNVPLAIESDLTDFVRGDALTGQQQTIEVTTPATGWAGPQFVRFRLLSDGHLLQIVGTLNRDGNVNALPPGAAASIILFTLPIGFRPSGAQQFQIIPTVANLPDPDALEYGWIAIAPVSGEVIFYGHAPTVTIFINNTFSITMT